MLLSDSFGQLGFRVVASRCAHGTVQVQANAIELAFVSGFMV